MLCFCTFTCYSEVYIEPSYAVVLSLVLLGGESAPASSRFCGTSHPCSLKALNPWKVLDDGTPTPTSVDSRGQRNKFLVSCCGSWPSTSSPSSTSPDHHDHHCSTVDAAAARDTFPSTSTLWSILKSTRYVHCRQLLSAVFVYDFKTRFETFRHRHVLSLDTVCTSILDFRSSSATTSLRNAHLLDSLVAHNDDHLRRDFRSIVSIPCFLLHFYCTFITIITSCHSSCLQRLGCIYLNHKVTSLDNRPSLSCLEHQNFT